MDNNEPKVDLQKELVLLFSEALVVASRSKELAKERAIRLNGIRKATEDYDYERACTLGTLLQSGLMKAQEAIPGTGDTELVQRVLEAIGDPLEGFSQPYAVLEELRFSYSQGTSEQRGKLYERQHQAAELIRNPPKRPLPAGFLDYFDQAFEAFLCSKKEKGRDWWSPDRRADAWGLAARVKTVAQHYNNLTDVFGWIETERTQAGSRCSSLIRERDPEGRFDPDLEEEYEQASRRSGTVALLASFLHATNWPDFERGENRNTP